MLKTKTITYTSSPSNDVFECVICWNDNIVEKRPCVLVAHAFAGLSQFEIDKAILLAELGYVGFAIDVYGKEKRTLRHQELLWLNSMPIAHYC